MMPCAIASPIEIRIAWVDHSFAISRVISGSRSIGISTIVVVVSLPPPLMIMSIVSVMLLPMLVPMVVPPMIFVR
jgi:hypothetical protein